MWKVLHQFGGTLEVSQHGYLFIFINIHLLYFLHRASIRHAGIGAIKKQYYYYYYQI